MEYPETSYELYHWGIKGMRWGIRRYQNRDGSLTPLGKQRLADNRIRTEDNLSEKVIPKGTKMYRTTAFEKDGSPSKSKYVTYLDVDRNMYRAGGLVKQYTDRESDDAVYEHEYELKTDLKIPSLKTARTIERKVLSDVKAQQEVAMAWVKEYLNNVGFTRKEIDEFSSIAKKIEKGNGDKVYKDLCKKYGDVDGDDKYYEAKYIADAKIYTDRYCSDIQTIEQSFGMAVGVKEKVMKELSKLGYNAMYDNASIGVKADGKFNKRQEGVEPLIIFDANATMKEQSVTKLDVHDQAASEAKYLEWQEERNRVMRDFREAF